MESREVTLKQEKMKLNNRPLEHLGEYIERNKTVLHQIAIELGLLKDDNFIFQYVFTDYGSYGDKKSYAIITPQNDTLIRIPTDPKDFENLPYKIIQKLNEHGFETNLITK